MKRWAIILTTGIVAVAVGAAGAYEFLTSSSLAPCSGTVLPSAIGNATDPATLPAMTAGSSGAAHVAAGSVIRVVAAESFWGSLVSQLGGNRTTVLSIVSDPNADPHEYEANVSDAQAIAGAQFVIENGVGYDDWAQQLVAAAATPNQEVLNIGALNGVTVGGGVVGGNPHMWYNPVFVNRSVAAMYSALTSIQPSSAGYFRANYASLNASLGPLYAQANSIRDQFAGTRVAATEDLFVYLANYTQLDLVSPPEFMEATAEGNDPPTQSVIVFQCQLESAKVPVLVYNEQTVSPITSNMEAIASSHHTTIVGITETVQPPTDTFQAWMGAEYLALATALNAHALGR